MVVIIQTGKSNTEDAIKKGKYPFFDRSNKIKKSNDYIFDGEYTIVPGEGIFMPKYYSGKFNLHQRAYALTSNKILNKYLFIFIFKN
jgi:type I restriction enzyme S subunit